MKKRKKNKLPKNKVQCTVCKGWKSMNTQVREQRIKQYGSLEILHKEYVCRSCKKGKKEEIKEKARKGRLSKTKIKCTKCGELKGMNPDRRAKLIGVFGSFEAVHEKYVCRKCRKVHNVRKDGKAKPVKRKRKARLSTKYKDTKTDKFVLPEWMKHPSLFTRRTSDIKVNAAHTMRGLSRNEFLTVTGEVLARNKAKKQA